MVQGLNILSVVGQMDFGPPAPRTSCQRDVSQRCVCSSDGVALPGIRCSVSTLLVCPFTSAKPLLAGGPSARVRDILTMRKDTQGNILWRPTEPLAKPDTAAFLEMHPTWTAQRFEHQVDRVLRDDLVMVFDFVPTAGTEEFGSWRC